MEGLAGYEVHNVVFCSSESKQPLKDVCFENGALAEPFFYMLSKKEQVSAGKQIILRSQEDERVFSVRASSLADLFGVSIPGKVEPEAFEGFDAFVESTSRNRNLDAGCEACFFGERPTKKANVGGPLQVVVGRDTVSQFREGGAMAFLELENEATDPERRLSVVAPHLLPEAMHGDLLFALHVYGVLERAGPIADEFFIRPCSEVEVWGVGCLCLVFTMDKRMSVTQCNSDSQKLRLDIGQKKEKKVAK